VVLVGQGPPARGGIPAVLTGLLGDRDLARWFDLRLINTTRVAERRAGRFSLGNIRNAAVDAARTYRAARSADIVHLHTPLLPAMPLLRALAICLAARLAGAAVICHAHSGLLGSPHTDVFQPGLICRLVIRGLRITHLVMTVAECGTQALRRVAPRLTVSTVANAVDARQFAPADPRQDPPLLLFVGQLSRSKGLEDLVAALQLLADRGVVVRTRLIGGAQQAGEEEANRIRELARRSRLPIELPGPLDPADVRQALSEAAIFCLPSHWEGQSISVLEAMASGLPVIVTAVGANPDAVRDGVDGIIVAPGDAPALAGALDRLIGDADLRARMGDAARSRVRDRYDRPHLSDRIAAQYRATLANRRRRSVR
jgi:glycosyltransferase involved in cell wall biosynthesis